MSEKDSDGRGEPSDRQMAATIILLVSDSNDSKFGEIIVLDEIHKAESAIEALLESRQPERKWPPLERCAHRFPPLLEAIKAA